MHRNDAVQVFPAHAGMVRYLQNQATELACIPSARRDGPRLNGRAIRYVVYSLHARGWTALLCKEKQWQKSIPYTHRDGPLAQQHPRRSKKYSLRTQGWTVRSVLSWQAGRVSPAYAGMGRKSPRCPMLSNCTPCTRRDGPNLVRAITQNLSHSLDT